MLLSCDTSPYGLRDLLSHKIANGDGKPVGFLYVRHFELKTEHECLIHIFNESKETPTIVFALIQRWALLLGA